jgi:hypothetical protein
MSYRTVDGTAIGGTNYVASEGVLEWGHQETPPKEIEIEIIDDDVLSGTVRPRTRLLCSCHPRGFLAHASPLLPPATRELT